MAGNRDDFTSDTIQRAAKRVGYLCSCPTCRVPTTGPSQDGPGRVSNIGEAAHICAAAPGGPRFDPNMTPEERKSIENCIWLCRTHARLIDTDSTKYTVELLGQWKKDAEAYAAYLLENGRKIEGKGDKADKKEIRFKDKNLESLTTEKKQKLYSTIKDAFNLSELHVLAFSIGIDMEEIGGSTKSERIIELINYCQRRNVLDKLIAQINKERGDLWNDQ